MTLTEQLSPDAAGIARAVDWLRQGQPVAIPTETVYGLAADARSGAAVAAIYAAKDRPAFNPLIVHVADVAATQRLAHLPEIALRLAEAFWPGALTLVAPLREDAGLSSLATAGLETVGLRVPAHPVAQAVLRAFGGPLAAPSANASGRISPTSADHVLDPEGGLAGRIQAVVDGGPCPVGVESTILGFEGDRVVLLRPGGVAVEEIEAVLGTPVVLQADPAKPSAPGQLSSHYAPRAALRLNADAPRAGETFIALTGDDPLALSDTGDLTQAAARLFDVLRRADRLGRPIAIAPVPEMGLGRAINDRLRRAAAPRPGA